MFYSLRDFNHPSLWQTDYDRLVLCENMYPNVFVLTTKEGTNKDRYTETLYCDETSHIIYSSKLRGQKLIPAINEEYHFVTGEPSSDASWLFHYGYFSFYVSQIFVDLYRSFEHCKLEYGKMSNFITNDLVALIISEKLFMGEISQYVIVRAVQHISKG